MSRPSENPLTFRSLYDSPLLSVRDYHCRISCGGPGEEEQPDSNQIVLMRYGAFRKHFGRRSVTADVNQAVFFSKQSTYRVSHPASCDDRGTVFVVSLRYLMCLRLRASLKCPVCDWDINDGGIKVKVGGKEITVRCDDCAKKAEEEPAKYASATE